MVGPRRLGIAFLVLAAAVATPALSAAQDPAVTVPEQPPATPLAPAAPSPEQPEQQGPPKKPSREAKPAAEAQAQPSAAEQAQPQSEAASQPKGGGAKAAASATVSTGDNFYSPRSVSISVGDTVTWRNDGQAPHSATANDGSFDTGVFNTGQSRSHRFTRAGTFSYYCTVHGQAQSGTVRVLSAAGGSNQGGSNRGGSAGSSAAQTEAQAVASPDAAGTSTSLPATGFAAIGLALVGFALLASGHLVGRLDGERPRARLRFLPIF